MGLLYFAFMMFGVFTVRVPRAGLEARRAGSRRRARTA